MKHGKFEISKGYRPRFAKETEEAKQDKPAKQVEPENKVENRKTPQTELPDQQEQAVKQKGTASQLLSGMLPKFKKEPKEKIEQEDTAKKEKQFSPARNTLDYLRDFVSMLSAVLLVLLLLLRIVVVSGSSMRNTLIDGDYIILLSNVFYSDYKQGDIVVAGKEDFRNGEPIIKRVIATEGQEVFINFEEGVVYVDGVALDEPYTLTPTTRPEGVQFPLVVDDGCVFVLGDNRDDSKDSRNPEIGQIDCREILGKAVFLLLPGVDDVTKKREFSRIGVVS